MPFVTCGYVPASGEGLPLSAVKPLPEGAARRRSKQVATPHHGVFARCSLSRLLVTPDTADFGPIWGAGVDTPTLGFSSFRSASLQR